MSFTSKLISWNQSDNKRVMPWKGQKDPYKVWLSEIILQQTRVEQGWAYYEKFLKKYPNINKLAAAKDEDVFKLWEGLGYYNRCRNLLHTARFISASLKGIFPNDYNEILKLKGIGSYTAAAISSFCFNAPYAVVDGNVIRVLSRVYGIAQNAYSTTGKRYFERIAQNNLDKNNPGNYNQAIMDFGAIICKPKLPLCSKCKMNNICVAYLENDIENYPVKNKTLNKKVRWFNYFIFKFGGKIFIKKRADNDIWKDLHEFFLYETDQEIKWDKGKVEKYIKKVFGISDSAFIAYRRLDSQQLTHQTIHGYLIEIKVNEITPSFDKYNGRWLTPEMIRKKAFPKFIQSATLLDL